MAIGCSRISVEKRTKCEPIEVDVWFMQLPAAVKGFSTQSRLDGRTIQTLFLLLQENENLILLDRLAFACLYLNDDEVRCV